MAAALAKSRGPVAASDAERLLATPTDDGYSVHGLYTAEDVAGGTPRQQIRSRRLRAWLPASRRRRRLGHPAAALAGPDSATAIADDLANGVTSLWLTDGEPDHLIAAVADVDLTQVPVVLEGFRDGLGLAGTLLKLGPLHPASSVGPRPAGLGGSNHPRWRPGRSDGPRRRGGRGGHPGLHDRWFGLPRRRWIVRRRTRCRDRGRSWRHSDCWWQPGCRWTRRLG